VSKITLHASGKLESQSYAEKNFARLDREVPNDLAVKEANLQKSHSLVIGSRSLQLEWLYKTMVELYTHVDRFTPCSAGCSSCCHYPVLVAEIEVTLIEACSKFKRVNHPKPQTNVHGKPCPFLRKGSCSIYEVRPLACRQHVTLDKDSKWCAPEVCNDIELPHYRMSEVQAVAEKIRDNDRVADIRTWFGESNLR